MSSIVIRIAKCVAREIKGDKAAANIFPITRGVQNGIDTNKAGEFAGRLCALERSWIDASADPVCRRAGLSSQRIAVGAKGAGQPSCGNTLRMGRVLEEEYMGTRYLFLELSFRKYL
jgi:hypothetical protein